MCRMPMVRHHWISFDYPNQLNIGFCRPTCLSFVLFRGLISTSALDSYMKFPPVCPILPRLLNAYYSDWCSCEPGLFSWAFRQSWRSKKIRFLDQNASKHHTKTSQANVDWWKSAHGISETPMETHHFQVPAVKTLGGTKHLKIHWFCQQVHPWEKWWVLACFTLENWAVEPAKSPNSKKKSSWKDLHSLHPKK